ncbi:MAG: hypothetical protein Q9163_000829 [Psora crenata]
MSTRPNAPSRTSTSKLPPPPTSIASTSLVHPAASLTGTYTISIGPKAIIQLRSRLDSTYAPIAVGPGSIISERASIGYLSPSHAPPFATSKPETLEIGEDVIVESSAIVEAASIGARTIIEVGAKVGKGTIIGANCKVCAMVEIAEGEVVGDNTVVWGNRWDERMINGDEKEVARVVTDRGRRAMIGGFAETLRGVWTGK